MVSSIEFWNTFLRSILTFSLVDWIMMIFWDMRLCQDCQVHVILINVLGMLKICGFEG